MGQGVPASQTVNSNPAQPAVKSGNAVKAVKKEAPKSPFAPKARVTSSASKAVAKPQLATKPVSHSPALNSKAADKSQLASKPVTHAPAAKKTTQVVTVHNTPSKAIIKTQTPVQAKATPKPVTPTPVPEKPAVTAPAVAQSAPVKLPNPGKRDPFQNPLAAAASRGPGAGCATGKRCLVVDQIVLKGIVQMKAGNFALVENSSRHPYVLHENDSLFNGSVVKITGDTVILREDSNDILGRPVSKEVVKKVSAPAV